MHRTFDSSGDDPQGELFNPNSADYDVVTFGLAPWQNGVKPNHRTSLIVDPPDGRIPRSDRRSQSGEGSGQRCPRLHHRRPSRRRRSPRRYSQDLGVRTACISMSGGPPILPGEYNSGLFIAQNPGYVVLEAEYGTEVRIIPLDGRPHPLEPRSTSGVAMGGAIGKATRWSWRPPISGPRDAFRGANPNTLKDHRALQARCRGRIEYSFTVDDPSTWTKPWTAIVPLNAYRWPAVRVRLQRERQRRREHPGGSSNPGEESQGLAGAPISQK